MDGVTPIAHPVTHETLDWDDVSTWWCFDCLEEADDYYHLDGFVRCFDCTAVWGEHHLCVQDWRHSVGLDLFPRIFLADKEDWELALGADSLDQAVAGADVKKRTRWRCVERNR